MTLLFLLITVVMDLFVSVFIGSDFAWGSINFVPMISLLFLVYTMIKQSSNNLYVYAFGVGLLVDLMMHSMLMTHAFIFVFVLIIMHEFQRHFSTSFLEIVLMGMVVIFLKELFLYGWYTLMNVVDVSFVGWYTSRLFVTLLGNIPLMGLAYAMASKHEKIVLKMIKKQQQSETTLWGFLKD